MQSKVVVIPVLSEKRDPERRAACIEVIARLPKVDEGFDASPASFVALRHRADEDAELAKLISAATTQSPLFPAITRPLVDAWAMTSLGEHTGRPEVAPWIRGWIDDDQPQMKVVFRRHLPLINGRLFPPAEMEDFLEVAGQNAAESLETEVWRVLEWLGNLAVDDLDRPIAIGFDNENKPLAIDRSNRPAPITARALAEKAVRARLDRQLANGWLMVAADLGGLRAGLLDGSATLPNENEPSLDLTHVDGALPIRTRRVESLDVLADTPLLVEDTFVVALDDDGSPQAWLVVERQSREAISEQGRSIAHNAQSLVEHQSWAEREAGAIAGRLRLNEDAARILKLAARLHDEGKRAERWQRAFHVPLDQRPLAKSKRAPNVAALGGYRHELGSLPRIEKEPEFLALDLDSRDLVLHLVAAHHGNARPILPIDGAEEAPTRLRARAREVALRFDRLTRRYGPWGLAWLESLLRAADQRASKRNDERDDG